MVLGSIYMWPPFSYIITIGEDIKASWIISPELEPPFGHAEMLSLKSFCKKTNINLQQAMDELKKQGIKLESEMQTIEEIARSNDLAPMELYQYIKHLEKDEAVQAPSRYTPELVEERFAGTGLGQKTVAKIVKDLNLDMVMVKADLAKKGIDIKENETIKNEASRLGVGPMDIMKAILIPDYQVNRK